MNEVYKGTPASEPFPIILERFMKNNPNMRHESLYLCESVDMNGNVIDTKIGVNLMTNYGLSTRFISGTDAKKNIWLGSGKVTPDPRSSQLTSYISNLGSGSDLTDYSTYYQPSYDATTKIWTGRRKVCRAYWDYTAGNNDEYEIWEIGVGNTQTTLLTHALIYDEDGVQTCIVKHPNAKLYITIYWTNSISMTNIPSLYDAGKFVLVDPTFQHGDGSSKNIYWSLLTRGPQYGYSDSGWVSSWDDMSAWNPYTTNDKCESITGDDREVKYDSGPGINIFFEKNYWYLSGICVSTNKWDTKDQESSHGVGSFACLSFEQLDDSEELETYYAYTNSNPGLSVCNASANYTGTELENDDMYRLDFLFGHSRSTYIDNPNESSQERWDYPYGMLPCTDFDISELNMYNYISKEWDIPVEYNNFSDTIYCWPWYYAYLQLFINYNGTDKNVYVYVNMYPHDTDGTPIPKIVSFSNSNMVIAATDEYWDPSTYVEISSLSNVPSELQQKRYYVVVSGTNAPLSPNISESDKKIHSIDPTNKPWEITNVSTGVLPKLADTRDIFSSFGYSTGATTNQSDNDRQFGQPLVSNTKGYFIIGYMLVFLDENKNCTRYNLFRGNNYMCCKHRRWITEDGDKIVMFATEYQHTITNDVKGGYVRSSYNDAANNFSVWTVSDENTTPTREDMTLVWSDSSIVDNNMCYHKYSWSDKGYLVCAKRRTENEFIFVNVYETDMPQHLVTNAKHCTAIMNTNLCCYQDTNLSNESELIFNIYDMHDMSVTDTIVVNNTDNYSVVGLFGYNSHVYIRVKDSQNAKYTFYYNIDNGTIEKLSDGFYAADSEAPYWTNRNIVFEDSCISFPMSVGDSSIYDPIVMTGNEWHPLYNATTTNSSSRLHNIYPIINTINDGKQVVLCCSSGKSYTNLVVDIGELFDNDNKQIQHLPYSYCRCNISSNTAHSNSTVLIPFNDGIIMVYAGPTDWNATNQVGRMWWFPIEMWIRKHIKGTTHTLNSYNAPTRFTLTKKLQYNITNDLSRLLPNS